MINTQFLRLFSLVNVILLCTNLQAQQPVNLSLAKKAIEHHYESGLLDQEMVQVYKEAWQQIERIAPKDNSIIIIDIDETALSNYDYFKLMGFTKGTEVAFRYWKSLGHCNVIKPTLSFYKKLIKKGFKVVFISCRGIEIYEQTATNLKKTGYHTFERIALRTQEDTKVPFYTYKKQKRYDLVNEGYEIIACIGDQWSDLEGEHTGIKIKLPNYILYE